MHICVCKNESLLLFSKNALFLLCFLSQWMTPLCSNRNPEHIHDPWFYPTQPYIWILIKSISISPTNLIIPIPPVFSLIRLIILPWVGKGKEMCHTKIFHFYDYFELKGLERQAVKKGHSYHPLSLWNQEIRLPYEMCPSCTRRAEDICVTRARNSGPKSCINKPCYFTNLLSSQIFLSCKFFTNLLFLYLKGIKASCSDCFF